MMPEEKDELFEEDALEVTEPVDEFGEKIETTNEEIMAEADTPDMTSGELEDIADEHVYQGD